jgi:hypothetical protein
MTALGTAGLAVGVRATRFVLRRAGFRRTVEVLGAVPTPLECKRPASGDPAAWANRIQGVSGRPYGGTCLDRSVFLWFLLRQRGLDGRIRIGVTLDGNQLEGHAWVELHDKVVNDAPDVAERFSVFEQDPAGIVFS